jgi:hypothetical protein
MGITQVYLLVPELVFARLVGSHELAEQIPCKVSHGWDLVLLDAMKMRIGRGEGGSAGAAV